MQGTVYPRPAKRVIDERTGRERRAPLRPNEEWTNPKTGRTVKAGPKGSSWTWQIVTGSKKAGNRECPSKGGYPTKKAASDALADALSALNKGDTRPLMKYETVELGTYLREWVEGRVDQLKASTLSGYREAIRVWIAPVDDQGAYRALPYVGAIPLRDVGADQITRLYAHLRAAGGRITKAEREAAEAEGREPVGPPLGTRSVQLAHVVLGMALADAAESGRIPYNPMERIPKRQRPRHKAKKQANRFWSPSQAVTFMEAMSAERLYALWCLALDTGARRGELSAVGWPDVDLDAGRVTIRENRVVVKGEVVEGTTKSSKTRTVRLDSRTVAALKAWKAQQATERMAAGPAWDGGTPGRSGWLWTDELGRAYHPERLSDFFEQAQDGLDVPRIAFHGLRHTSATVALANLVPVHVVSARLGHATVSITLDLYAHVIPGQDTDAATAIGDAIYGVATGTDGGS